MGAPPASSPSIRTAATSISFCVAPKERGGGLARALIEEAKRRAPGIVDLNVNVANPRACRFYQREGFLVVGVGTSPLSGLPMLHLRWRAQAG